MPAPHLGQTSTRLLLFGSAVAGCALWPIIGTTLVTTAVTTATATAIGGIAGGLLANDIGEHLKLAHRLREKKNSLRNHDLTKAVGCAISIVLFAVAEEHKARKNEWHKDFEKLAKAAPNYWKKIADNRQDDFAGIREENLPAELFSTKASEFGTVKALDEDSWIEFLNGLCAENKVDLDVLIRDTAQKLETIFPKALREVLKDDFEHGGKAFASLTLSMLSEISAGIKENQAAISQLLQKQGIAQPSQQEYNEILSRLDVLANQQKITNQRTIPPEIEKALKQVSTEIESGFEEVLREMGVQYQEIRKEIETLRNDILDAILKISTRDEDEKRHQEVIGKLEEITPANLDNLDHAYPTITDWVGRAGELQTVREYLANSNIALIKIVGVGGIGKSTLAAKVFEEERSKFEGKFWWDLTISPNFTEFVRNALRQLGRFSLQDIQQIAENNVIDWLVNLLQEKPFLIVIDNLETVLKSGWEGSLWEKFFCRWLGCAGKSKIIVTSQDKPNLTELKGKTLHLEQGLNSSEGATLLRNLGVLGETTELEDFVESVGGSPLCLMLVAGLLVTEEEDDPQIKYLSRYGNLYEIKGIHRGKNSVSVKDVFEESFARLSDQQKQLLLNLSVYRLPFGGAAALVMYDGTESEAENDLKLLAKRCFLLKGKDVSGFKFQPVVLGYLKSKAGDLKEVHRKAIEYYRSIQKSEGWKTKKDVSGYIEICYHLCELGERGAAFKTIRICDEFLTVRGYYGLLVGVYEQIITGWKPQDKNEKKMFATSLNNLGNAYAAQGDDLQSIDYYEQSLKIYQEIRDRRGEVNSLMGLAKGYDSLEDDYQTIDYYEQSLRISQEIKDGQGEARSLNGLGNSYMNLAEEWKAIDYYEQSLKIYQEIKNRQGEASSLNGLGSVYINLGENLKAIDYYNQSLKIYQEIRYPQGEARSLKDLGSAYTSLTDYFKSIDYYEQSLKIYQEIKDWQGERSCWLDMAYLYKQKGDVEKSLEAFNKADQILLPRPKVNLFPQWMLSLWKIAKKIKFHWLLYCIFWLFFLSFFFLFTIVITLWLIIDTKINRPR